jgi:hypothetical protein
MTHEVGTGEKPCHSRCSGRDIVLLYYKTVAVHLKSFLSHQQLLRPTLPTYNLTILLRLLSKSIPTHITEIDNRHLIMYISSILALLASSALAAPTGDLFRRQQDCAYYPGQKDQATSTYILRIEPASTIASNITLGNSTIATNGTLGNSTTATNGILNSNATTADLTLGYLDAFSTSHALLAPSRKYASEAFNAPTWNTNRKLIFWNSNENQEYERGFNIDQTALDSPESIAAVISTPGCGTPFVELVNKYSDRGECGIAGQKVRAQTGCPASGTTNNGGSHCTEQKFFLCDNTGLQGIADQQKAVYYGVAATARAGQNCQEVDLVSECV